MTHSEPEHLSRTPTQSGDMPAHNGPPASLADAPTRGPSPSTESGLPDGVDGSTIDFESDWPHAGDRFEIDEQPLGSGGMGDVYRAHDRKLGRDVALKFLKSELARNPRALARFRTEARSQAQLSHPHIVRIYDFFRNDDGAFISMELVDGDTLAAVLRERKSLPEDEVIELGVAVCGALAEAHSAGLIHRDIKPANILITKSGTARLTDFGLVHLQESDFSHTKTGAVLGTFEYMSPEQHRNPKAVDARSDIWSLGATLYESAVGDSPRVILGDRIPQRLQSVLLKALDRNPAKRFQNAEEFSRELKSAFSATAQGPAPVPTEQLQAGQCAECGGLNDLNNEFCVFCRAELRNLCVECDHSVGVWAAFCGKCGADVASGIQKLKDEVARKVEHVAELRKQCHHDKAFPILSEIIATTHPSVAGDRERASAMLEAMRGEQTEHKKRRKDVLSKARKACSRGNFQSCLELIQTLESGLHNDAIRKLNAEARKKLKTAQDLEAEIESAAEGDWDNQFVQRITEYHKLCPAKSESAGYLRRVLDDRLRRAETCRAEQRIQEGIQLLSALPKAIRDDAATALLKTLRSELNQSSDEATTSPKPGWVVCPHCPPNYPHVRAKNLSSHIAGKHSQQTSTTQPAKGETATPARLTRCPHCDVKLREKNLDKHIRKQHPHADTGSDTQASVSTVPAAASRPVASSGSWLKRQMKAAAKPPVFTALLIIGIPVLMILLPVTVIVDLVRRSRGYDSIFESTKGPYGFTFFLFPLLLFALYFCWRYSTFSGY